MQNPDTLHGVAEFKQDFSLALDGCAKEPIHIPGTIQPHGYLLCYHRSRNEICAVSKNFTDYLQLSSAQVLSKSLADILGEANETCLLNHYQNKISKRDISSWQVTPVTLQLHSDSEARFHAFVHATDDLLVIELEQQVSDGYSFLDFTDRIRGPLSSMLAAGTESEDEVLETYLEEIRELTGYDRVCIYKFDEHYNGQVIAEVNGQLPPFLGLHFPASDIPSQARQLYLRSRIRMIPDVRYQSIPLQSAPYIKTEDIDLSYAYLRSVSPIHIKYLENMGVGASMSVSLVVNDRLWGLVVCHHYETKNINGERRGATEYLGHLLSLYLSRREKEQVSERKGRIHLLQRSLFSFSGQDINDFYALLREHQEAICTIAQADGFMWVFENHSIMELGVQIRSRNVEPVVRWLDEQQSENIYYCTRSLPEADALKACFEVLPSGMLAVRFPTAANAYLIWFRQESLREIQWAGSPEKQIGINNDGVTTVQPRSSFDEWKEHVGSTSTTWSELDIDLALTFSRSLSVVHDTYLERGELIFTKDAYHAQERDTGQQVTGGHLAKNDLHRQLIYSSPDAIAAIGNDQRFLAFSPLFLKMFTERFDKKPEVGDLFTHVIPATAPEFERLKRFQDTNAENLSDELFTSYTDAEEHQVDIMTTFSRIKDEQGKILGVQMVVKDVSHLRQQNQTSDSLTQKYKLLTRKVLPLVWTANADGHFSREQHSWEDFTGQKPDQYEGLGWLNAVSTKDQAPIYKLLENQKGEPGTYEFNARVWNRRAKAYQHCLIYMMPIPDQNQNTREWFGIGIDIQKLKYREAELHRALETIKESNEHLKNFAHVASHDLQEPLRVVRSYLGLIAERYSNDMGKEGRELVHFALDGADRMKALIQELLNYARLDTDFRPQSVDLNHIVKKSLSTLKLRIEESGAHVEVPPMPVVMGVSALLEQLFTNLLSNSLKFMDDHTQPLIRIHVKERKLSWQIRIEDNGLGIDAKYAENIFQLFFRMKSRTKYPGTGMGLAICKRVISLHGGKIWLDSSYKQGTCIAFTLRKYH